MAKIKMHIPKAKLPFYPPCEVKCRLQNGALTEALGVDPDFICHHLNVNPLATPKKQLLRRPSKEHAEAVRQEVTKLK